MTRHEQIIRNDGSSGISLAPGVVLTPFAGDACGARGVFTGLVEFQPGAELPYHLHPCTETVIVLSGAVHATVEGRQYELNQLDTMQVPPGTGHSVRGATVGEVTRVFVAFANGTPERTLIEEPSTTVSCVATSESVAEKLTRFKSAEVYELAPRAAFRDLFWGDHRHQGICGGYGLFEPGAGLPCHTHDFDESITIIQGKAVCQVAGRRYELSNCDTAMVPNGRPHRFINESNEAMAMVWVYAGNRPSRTLVVQQCCDATDADQLLGVTQSYPLAAT